jgi:uncharacterized protein
MSRPRKCRWVVREPGVTFFKPQGIPLKTLEHVQITVDELEALRLSDYEGLSHEEVAQQMKVSRPTVTRMLAKAHRAVAEALVHGKAIRIEGGDYCLEGAEVCCPKCGARTPAEQAQSSPDRCAKCDHDHELNSPPLHSRMPS